MENTKINTYLGQKGYTIHKNEISIEKQKQIRNDFRTAKSSEVNQMLVALQAMTRMHRDFHVVPIFETRFFDGDFHG
jgi:hypothetical protein